MTYINVTNVRNAGGFPETLIGNSQISDAIVIVEGLAERSMNCTFEPVLHFERIDISKEEYIYADRNPVLRVDYLEIDDEVFDREDYNVSRESGKITLNKTSISSKKQAKLNYWSGFLITERKFKAVMNEYDKGNNVSIEISNADEISVDDWVEFTNRDGVYTSCQVLNKNNNEIVVDRLNIDLESNSICKRLILPSYIKRLIELEAVIYLAMNAIGATYVFNASYSLGDLSLTKGVPYTHWRESVEKAIKERDSLKKIIKPRIKIV